MSRFLVNLARRSAGLAPVVRARSRPIVVADDAMNVASESITARDATPAPTVVMMPIAAPVEPTIGAPRAAAPVVSPTPLAHATAQVAQRTPVASAVASVAPAAASARPVDAPIVAPRNGGRSTDAVVATIVPASIAVVDASHIAHDEEPRATNVRDEPRAIAPRTVDSVATESSDAPAPVVVTIQPAEQPVAATVATRGEPAPERTVHVRIGAIEIYGADNGSQAQATAAPAAAAPAAPSAGGFDDYAALRSYTPWAW